MEISPKLLQPIPFYMTYPGYFGSERESQMIHDMEYYSRCIRIPLRNASEELPKF